MILEKSLPEDARLVLLKFFMSTGVINETESQSRQMKAVLEQKGYPLPYLKVNQVHSRGNWRALIDGPLMY